jgi:hypothetical protein
MISHRRRRAFVPNRSRDIMPSMSDYSLQRTSVFGRHAEQASGLTRTNRPSPPRR